MRKKGPNVRARCRYAYPQPEFPAAFERHTLVVLKKVPDAERTRVSLLEKRGDDLVPQLKLVVTTQEFEEQRNQLQDRWADDPLCVNGSKHPVVLVNIKRAHGDERVAFWSPLVQNLMRGNMSTNLQGTAAQSRAAADYLAKYVSKDQHTRSTLVNAALHAIAKNDTRESAAHDRDEESGRAATINQRFMNSAIQGQEFTTELMISCLRGYPSEYFSHNAAFFPVRQLVEWINPSLRANGDNGHDAVLERDVSDGDDDTQDEVNDGDDVGDAPAEPIEGDLHEDDRVGRFVEPDESEGVNVSAEGRFKIADPLARYKATPDSVREVMSFYEQCALLEYRRSDGIEPENQQGRSANRRIRAKRHLYEFAVRSKFQIPQFAVKLPPHPGAKPWDSARQKMADKWATWAITLFLPFERNDDDEMVPYAALRDDKYAALEDYVRVRCDAAAPIFSINVWDPCAHGPAYAEKYTQWGRLAMLRQFQLNCCPSLPQREMLDAHRRQGSEALSEELVKEAQAERIFASDSKKCIITENEIQRILETPEAAHQTASKAALEALYGDLIGNAAGNEGEDDVELDDDDVRDAPRAAQDASNDGILRFVEVTRAVACLSKDEEDSPPHAVENPGVEGHVPSAIFDTESLRMEWIARIQQSEALRDLTPTQRTAADGIITAVSGLPGANKLLVLHGGPGCGKTHTLNAVANALQRGNKHVSFVAPTGIAATLLHEADGHTGRTIHKFFGVDSKFRPAKNSTVIAQVTERVKRAAVIVIDEMSMLRPAQLAQIDDELRRYTGSVAPFGGKVVVLSGDFNQLPPVAGSLLCTSDTFASSSLDQRGVDSFNTAIVFMLERTREGRFDAVQGEIIDAMLRHPHETLRSMSRHYASLRREDLCRKPDGSISPWAVCPIITRTNATRLLYNEIRSKYFAQHHRLPVVRWRHDPYPQLSTAQIARIYPNAVGHFVGGAPAMLLQNLAPHLGRANGSVVRMKTLVWDTDTRTRTYLATIRRAAPGTIVDVPPPKYMIVETLEEQEEFAIAMSHVNAQDHGGPVVKFNGKTFPVDLHFAVTFYKVQGGTLNHAIIDVSSGGRRYNFSELYVACSRVRTVSGVRLFNLDAAWKNELAQGDPLSTKSKCRVMISRAETDALRWITERRSRSSSTE